VRKPICLGIAGGSGSGKSWLAGFLKSKLGARVVVVCQDWYYFDNSKLSDAEVKKLNVDHPRSIETSLMAAQVADLCSGKEIDAPRYDYATHARLKQRVHMEPAELLILDGLLVMHEKKLRDLMDFSVFIEVPDDVRLMRRIRRDTVQRRVDLEETLRLYEHCVKPMHDRFIKPSSAHATWVWRQLEDKKFPEDLLNTLRKELPPAVEPATPKRRPATAARPAPAAALRPS
jgi:uridine kinase